jgi:anthraniloyl-CoA monooxygenase
MLLPLQVRGTRLKNRIVVSPMATYSAVDGVVQDFHLVHLAGARTGGRRAGDGRDDQPEPAGPHHARLPGPVERRSSRPLQAHRRLCARAERWAHRFAAGPQRTQGLHAAGLGADRRASGRSGANWPLLAASAVAYGAQNQVPQAMTRADMDAVLADFVASTRRAAEAGFDWLELHCAHGYLLSSFITPLTNLRTDAYGGAGSEGLANRCRYPLEVFRAMRAVWPADRPMSVRISAHDWAPGGHTADDAIAVARLFKEAGCDVIDVSSGQTTREARPVYGRMYQTPFADRIRNEVGIQTIAVGAITQADQANSIIAAGRADLCAVARPHLADPAWTLHEAAALQSRAVDWPRQYLSGRDQLYREIQKQQELAAATHGAQGLAQAAERAEGL